MAQLQVEAQAFLAGLQQAAKDMDGDGEQILHQAGDQVVTRAQRLAPRLKHPDPRFRAGDLASSIDAHFGRDVNGPWVDVGSSEPYALFVEYGTFKDTPQPFMRPALNLAARAIRVGGGRVSRGRARATATRMAKRAIIRRALRSGQISGAQARSLSSQVSSRFRFRARIRFRARRRR